MTDFVALCRAARERPGPATADRLWAAWFALPVWHFIASPSPMGPLPFSTVIEQKKTVLAFTTPAAASAYGAAARVVGPPLALAPEVAVQQRLPIVRGYGVTGFLVDIGPDGFLTSLDQLWDMARRLVGSLAWWRALPTWHLAVSSTDPVVPELQHHEADLVADVWSRPGPNTFAGTPRDILRHISEVELVRYVRFDGRAPLHDLIDLVAEP